MKSLVLLGLFFVLTQLACGTLIISVQDEGHNIVRYSIFNSGKESETILSYGTPFEGLVLHFPVLRITSESHTITYLGSLARRVNPPPPEAYLTIPPGSSLSIRIPIHEFYAIPEESTYELNVVIPNFNPTLTTAAVGKPIRKILSKSIQLDSESEESTNDNSRANSFENCNSSEQSAVVTATNTAISQAGASKSCMNLGTCSSQSVKWLGNSPSVNVAYYTYDYNIYTNIYNTLKQNGIHAYCNPAGCGPTVYAYVYPNDKSQTVYLCGAFWSQPSERANTIVHEMSHFNVIGGTEDYVYGQTACLNLAKTDPYKASHNADNVCYFSDSV